MTFPESADLHLRILAAKRDYPWAVNDHVETLESLRFARLDALQDQCLYKLDWCDVLLVLQSEMRSTEREWERRA